MDPARLTRLEGGHVLVTRLHEGHVGGGFGIRGELYPEDVLVSFAALRLGRPVKWIEDRREHLMAANHSRQQRHNIRAAVDRMTRIAAMESGKLGYGVRVNCIYPGLVPTDMGMQLANDIVAVGLAPDAGAAVASVVEQTPLGRLGEVGDMADAVVFLCSREARFITGAGLPVDGGMGM